MKRNADIKQYAKKKKVCLWRISEALGYAHESAFSRVLRHELSREYKEEIKEIIDKLAESE